MYQTILNDTNFYRYLLKLDEDLAAEARGKGCECGGKLHRALYPRKPRRVPEELEEDYSRRHSFCCARDGCRKRTTPPSFRFLSRRVYVSVVVVLVTALRHGDTPGRVAQLREVVGVSRRTLERWRQWCAYSDDVNRVFRRDVNKSERRTLVFGIMLHRIHISQRELCR